MDAAASGSKSQNILEVVRKHRSELRRSEDKVAAVILADPQRSLASTIGQIAEAAGVSDPTVVRFCNAVGCDGFADLKLRLAQSLALGHSATHSVIQESDTLPEVVGKIFDFTMSSLDWARHHLDEQALQDAICLLETARRIEFFGFGASGIVALDAQQKFPLFGVPCGAQTDTHQQVMTASLLRKGDVAVVISNTGTTLSAIEVARLSQENGASVIGISGNLSPLLEHCNVALVMETLENTNVFTPTISRIGALVLIDVLSTAVALRRGETHSQDLVRMKSELQQLRQEKHL